jgi:hypothetical protein
METPVAPVEQLKSDVTQSDDVSTLAATNPIHVPFITSSTRLNLDRDNEKRLKKGSQCLRQMSKTKAQGESFLVFLPPEFTR